MKVREFIVPIDDTALDTDPMLIMVIRSHKEQIRCEECKHRPKRMVEDGGDGFNLMFPDTKCPCECAGDGWYSWMPNDDFYCANAERKEE